MKHPGWLAAVLALTTLGVCAQTLADQHAMQVRATVKFHGPAFWRASHTSPETPLKARDQGRFIHSGEEVRCGPGCLIKLGLEDGQVVSLTEKDGWYPMPWPAVGSSKVRSDLDSVFEEGAIPRGAGSLILWPFENNAVRTQGFVVRWAASKSAGEISLAVCMRRRSVICRPDSDGLIWRQDGIRGDSGSLDSDALRQALSAHPPNGKDNKDNLLVLTLADQAGNRTSVSFLLLSPHEDSELQQELARWDNNPDAFFAHIGRGCAFERHNLFREAAVEYEAALQEAPESNDVLERAINAHKLAGESSRARELEKLLRSGTSAP
jgi:hypothetical protein